MVKVDAIIEARMGSARLPGKTMFNIVGKPVIGLLLERLRYASKINNIIVATTTKSEDDTVEDFCRQTNTLCFRGSSEDVLGRVYNAAKKYHTDVVVEVTADCPLLDPWLIDECIEIFLDSDCDYLSNFITQSYPPGIDVQIFSFKVLEEINHLAKEEIYREHVSFYIQRHPEKYKLKNVKAPPGLTYPDWHLELDEEKDYTLIKKIYENLYPINSKFTTKDIIRLLKNNPNWLQINKDVKRIWESVYRDT